MGQEILDPVIPLREGQGQMTEDGEGGRLVGKIQKHPSRIRHLTGFHHPRVILEKNAQFSGEGAGVARPEIAGNIRHTPFSKPLGHLSAQLIPQDLQLCEPIPDLMVRIRIQMTHRPVGIFP